MRLTSNEQALRTIFRGVQGRDTYWRVVGTLGNWKFYYCDKFGQKLDSQVTLRPWGVSLSQVSEYAWKLVDDVGLTQYSPVVHKIKELENRYANRKTIHK
jgi:hypothetical protein